MYKGKKKDYFVYNRLELFFDRSWFCESVLGFSNSNFLSYKKRLETLKNFDYEIFISVIKTQMPLYFYFFNNRYIYNIFFLDLICSYRGYRHCQGLPLRGQRTWSNSNSSYTSNTSLRQFRVFFFKKLSGTTNTNLATQLHMAEQINLLWKIQWDLEWREARKKQKKTVQNKKKSSFIVELASMSKNDVSGYTRRGAAAKKKMYKQKKNQFTLGFDVGFSKNISLENSNYVLTEK